MVKKRRDAVAAKLLLSNGENPYEIQRHFLRSKLQQRNNCQMEHAIAAGRQRILKQLLCEEHAWSKELKVAEQKQVCADQPDRQSLLPGCNLSSLVDLHLFVCEIWRWLTEVRLDEAGL